MDTKRSSLSLFGLTLILVTTAPVAAQELASVSIAEVNAAFDAGHLTAERLVEMSLARIAAFDDAGPELNAIITLNPKALETARALDAERERSGPRSPLHGIPVVLKDNFDTSDLATTGGSFVLADSLPPDDAFLVKKLRDAGAIVLAKTNMSELASGDARSSLGGITRNPYDPTRSPSGSSQGTAVAIAAGYVPMGLGTDTGGSIRLPTSANGIAGIRPTQGLLSRDGIIPLSWTFDMPGPMARTVEGVAIALGVLTGVDAADATTAASEGKFETDYTKYLDPDALVGARIGVARQFFGQDPDIDWVMEASIETMRAAGVTFVEVELPEWLLKARVDLYWTLRAREFKARMSDYLATLGPEYPKTVSELLERTRALVSPSPEGFTPNASRGHVLVRESASGKLEDFDYLAVEAHGLPMIRDVIAGLFDDHDIDAIIYPTAPTRATLLDADPPRDLVGGSALNATMGSTPTNLASLAGFPDLVVPAGFTARGLPVSVSFLGVAFAEPRLFALGYAFEQLTRARRVPAHTPPLPGESIEPR